MAATCEYINFGFFVFNNVDAAQKNIQHVKGTIDLC